MEEHAAQNPKITSKQAKKGKKPSTPGAKGKAGDKAKGQDALTLNARTMLCKDRSA